MLLMIEVLLERDWSTKTLIGERRSGNACSRG